MLNQSIIVYIVDILIHLNKLESHIKLVQEVLLHLKKQPNKQTLQSLKHHFTAAPVLHHPDLSQAFFVEVDSSNIGIRGKPFLKATSTLRKCTHVLLLTQVKPSWAELWCRLSELPAMKAALKEWQHWLEGAEHPITILTVHRNLEYLKTAKRVYLP